MIETLTRDDIEVFRRWVANTHWDAYQKQISDGIFDLALIGLARIDSRCQTTGQERSHDRTG